MYPYSPGLLNSDAILNAAKASAAVTLVYKCVISFVIRKPEGQAGSVPNTVCHMCNKEIREREPSIL